MISPLTSRHNGLAEEDVVKDDALLPLDIATTGTHVAGAPSLACRYTHMTRSGELDGAPRITLPIQACAGE